MRSFPILLIATALATNAQTVTTFAGNGTAGYGGDNGPAAQAQINAVVGLAADIFGNVYLADQNNHRVRKVDSTGKITTLAGTGTPGFGGDGGQAAQAQLNLPLGVCVDPVGNVFVNDYGNRRIRKIDTSGKITTVAGNGINVHSGDGGPATQAGMVIPIRCAVDRAGNLYIADQGAHRIRKVDSTGTITTFAGTGAQGFSGDGNLSTLASMNNPTAVATDSSGAVYITDQFNHRIRKVDSTGIINTVAGNGVSSYGGDGGVPTQASFSFPGSIVVDSAGSLFIVDTQANRIRKVSGGVIQTIAGTGGLGSGGDGGPALQATFNNPFAIALDQSGNIYVGDTQNNKIRKITGISTPTPPTIDADKVANGATYISGGLVPGSWAQAKGTDISAVTRIWKDSDFVGLGNGLPTTLDGIGVKVNNLPAAVYFISPTQVSFQVPAGITGSVNVQVTRNGVAGNLVPVNVTTSAPGIFPLIVGGKNYSGGVYTDGKYTGDPSIGSAFRRGKPGEAVQLFATGLQVSPAGSLVSVNQLSGVTVTVGGITVNAVAALVGVGLFQVNFTIPQLSPGDYPIAINLNGISSPTTINTDPQAQIVLPVGN
jgi:uncharacterized protein (TIGR03437 family)